MSKAILVIDMPESCDQCPLLLRSIEERCCVPEKRNSFTAKPYWCPLKQFPKKRTANTELPSWAVEITQEEFDRIEKNPDIIYFIKENVSDEYASGWDDCIDEILR